MNNLKRWSICAVLFFICFLILRSLGSNKPIMEGFGHGGFGHGRMGHGGFGRGGGYGRGIGRGYNGYGYGGGYLDASPLYIYNDSDYNYDYDYDFRPPYLRRYIPVVSYY